MKIKKLGALLVSVALCAGMAAPAFAYGGEPVEEVEQPVLTSTTDEEDVVTVTDEETGALTPEQLDAGGRLPHRLFRWQRSAVHYAGVEVGCDFLSGD